MPGPQNRWLVHTGGPQGDRVFKVAAPAECEGTPRQFPDAAASDLSARFHKKFEKFQTLEQELADAAPAGG